MHKKLKKKINSRKAIRNGIRSRMMAKIQMWEKQKNISNKMQNIRKDMGYNNAEKIIKDIEEHYRETQYKNEYLFYRLNQLELGMEYYKMFIGTLVGTLFGIAFEKPETTSYISLMLTLLGMITVTTLLVSFLLKLVPSVKKGYIQYLNEKEIEIIRETLNRKTQV